MKKYIVLCAGFCFAVAMTSCKSSESAYKKAYEKAKQYDTQTAQHTAQPAYEEPAVVAEGIQCGCWFFRSAVECRRLAAALEECWL